MEPIVFTIPEKTRSSVVTSLPLVNDIKNADLRAKVIEAWALSLSLNGYTCMEDLPGSGVPGGPVIGNQVHHILGVAKLALATVDILEEVLETPLGIDRDLLLACALCHDVGKPYEYNPANRERWEADPRQSGLPGLRHTMYGVYIAQTVGLPEVVVHTAGCHSPEGRFVRRSLNTTVVHFADETFWQVLESAFNWQLPKM